MKEENAIEVKDIKKAFKIYYDKGNTIKDKVITKGRGRYEKRQVLDGISFEVKRGEAIGLIGHNGCGKSTTLKLLTKIMYPDSGTISMRGRVSSLIELGAGFHPDLSGRENIYINASIFGLSKKEIDKRLDDIIAFSELEEFIDNPVRTYSSGMYMRLAFAVAINVDADILLIDEILAVGDAGFQAKCFNRLKEIKANGTTIVIVSHSLGQIEQICSRSIWLDQGKIREEGKPRHVHPAYLDYMGRKRQEIAEREEKRKKENTKRENDNVEELSSESNTDVIRENEDQEKQNNSLDAVRIASEQKEDKRRWGNGKARIKHVQLLNKDKKNAVVFETQDSMQIVMNYVIREKVQDAVLGIGIFRNDGIQVYGTNTRIDKFDEFDLIQDGTLIIDIPRLNLIAGIYKIDLAIESGDGIPVDYYREAIEFQVYSLIGDVGIARLEHNWNIN